jgi:hypothetical protein
VHIACTQDSTTAAAAAATAAGDGDSNPQQQQQQGNGAALPPLPAGNGSSSSRNGGDVGGPAAALLAEWRAANALPQASVSWLPQRQQQGLSGPGQGLTPGPAAAAVPRGSPADWVVLGIESSCDDTAAAVIRGDGTVLSHRIASQV